MKGLGTIVNVLAIIVAGGLGVLLRGKLKTRFQELMLQVLGIGVIAYGCWGIWDGLMVLQTGQLETTGTILVIFALLVGTVFGESFALERGLIALGQCFRRFSEKEEEKEQLRRELEEKKKAIQEKKASDASQPSPATKTAPKTQKRPTLSELPTYDLHTTRTGSLYVDGFLIASVLCAINALAFRGPVADCIDGSATTLFIKSAIDAVIVFTLAMIYGSGVTFSAISVLVVEGLLSIIAIIGGDLLTMTLMNQLVLIASVITVGMGINLTFGKRLRVANTIPALLIPPIYGLVMMLVEKIIGE